MRLRGHLPLDLVQPLHVLRAELLVEGRTFLQGEVLPWRDLGLDQRKVRQLWSMRRIEHQRVDSRDGAEPVSLSPASPAPDSPHAVEAPAPSPKRRR